MLSHSKTSRHKAFARNQTVLLIRPPESASKRAYFS
jgi:hypothetical protein